MFEEQHIAELISLYNENKLTKYVLEKELSNFLGDDWMVQIVSQAKATTTTSYGIFVMPEKLPITLHVICYIDECALKNFYTPEELCKALHSLAGMKQFFIKSLFKLLKEHSENVLTFSDVIACFLKLYKASFSCLEVEGKDFLPTPMQLDSLILAFENEANVRENTEALTAGNIVPCEVVEAAHKISHDFIEKVSGPIVKFVDEMHPVQDLYGQHARSFCDGTYKLSSNQIPWDYTPSTNQ